MDVHCIFFFWTSLLIFFSWLETNQSSSLQLLKKKWLALIKNEIKQNQSKLKISLHTRCLEFFQNFIVCRSINLFRRKDDPFPIKLNKNSRFCFFDLLAVYKLLAFSSITQHHDFTLLASSSRLSYVNYRSNCNTM